MNSSRRSATAADATLGATLYKGNGSTPWFVVEFGERTYLDATYTVYYVSKTITGRGACGFAIENFTVAA